MLELWRCMNLSVSCFKRVILWWSAGSSIAWLLRETDEAIQHNCKLVILLVYIPISRPDHCIFQH